MIPQYTLESLERYVKDRTPPGVFLTAVLQNNLVASFSKADAENRKALYDIVKYIYNKIPGICWGSPEKVRDWLNGKDIDDGESQPEAA